MTDLFSRFTTISRTAIISAIMAVALPGCSRIDDKRLPPVPVYINFTTIGDWSIYGVAGAGSYRYFIKADRQPAGYPYSAANYTGFGGVLLIGDIHSNPIAYDMACPVECRSDIRISVNDTDFKAECPVCHSVYDVITNYGTPLSGPALSKGYGLTKYYVGPGLNGEHMVISR